MTPLSNRHVILGRFGLLDTSPVPVKADEVLTQVDLVAAQKRLGHGLGQALDDLCTLGVTPSETGLDLAILAALVHAADTRIARGTESQDTWTRELRIIVPVSDPTRWNTTAPLLRRMLDFLTGDRWEIQFRARPTSFATIISARPTAPPPMFEGVSLFSGGVDSLVGAINSLEAASSGTSAGAPLFVSHAGEGATSDAQHKCFNALKAEYTRRGTRVARLRVWVNFPDGLVDGVGSESTTRGRSFLFIALAALAGSGLRTSFNLGVPENGLIALNVPLDMLRLGSLSTRTTHPFYLECWNELLAILDIPGIVTNRYWDRTKGEMVAACANLTLLRDTVTESLSCASPAKARWQGHGIEHCGYCLPCLIRRAAFESAWGCGNDPTRYTVQDLHAKPLNTLEATGQQVRSFQLAAARLHRRPELAKVLIHKPGPLPPDTRTLDALADVYRRGLREVAALLDGVETRPE